MRKFIYLTLAFIAILIIACNNKSAKENPYEGVWVITYSKQVTPDTTIERTQISNPNVKLLTKSHYAFGSQAGTNKINGGGGEYKYKGDTFISYPKYHTFSAIVGDSLVMKSKIEGDLWTVTYGYENDTLKVDVTEIWKRIIE